jgi:hypothetical protein
MTEDNTKTFTRTIISQPFDSKSTGLNLNREEPSTLMSIIEDEKRLKTIMSQISTFKK